MYEPLLQVTLPNYLVDSIRGPAENLIRRPRKVVLVAEVWFIPQELRAEGMSLSTVQRNTALIVGNLLQSGKVGVFATGNEGQDAQFLPPPPILMPLKEREKLIKQAGEDLEAQKIHVEDYISIGLNPGVPMVGVGDKQLFTNADELLKRLQSALVVLSFFEAGTPILARLRNHLAEARGRMLSPQFQRAERLFASIKEQQNVKILPQILQFALELGLELEAYPHLVQLQRLLELETVNPWDLSREQNWLRQTILDRLLGGKIDAQGGLKALFEAELRQASRSGEDTKNLLQSERPLYDCAQLTLTDLTERAAEDIERNETLNTGIKKRLLDIAATFRLNDRNYTNFRAAVGVQSFGHPLDNFSEFSAELDDLETAVLYSYASSSQETQLHELGQNLSDLEHLVKLQLDSKDAERILAYPSSATEVATSLQKLGVELTPHEKLLATLFDTTCLPVVRAIEEIPLGLAKVMTDNLLKAMSKHTCDTAVLMCGGFHLQRVMQELMENEQTVCSIITPPLHLKPKTQEEFDPQTIRESTHSPRISIHLLGGIRERLRELQQNKAADSSTGIGDGSPTDYDYLGTNRKADARMWSEQQFRKEVIDQIDREIRGGFLQECRVCHRQAPVEESAIVSQPGNVPDLVLACKHCQRFVCTHCAGYAPVAFFAGSISDSERKNDRTAGILVCNIHGEPLGDQKKPRLIGGKWPGHSLFD